MLEERATSVLRVAVFQRRPLFDDIDGTTLRLLDDLTWSEAQGVHLAVFPECYLQGYATDRQTIAQRALGTDSPPFKAFVAALAGFSADAIVGFIERRHAGFYNAAAVIRDGTLAGIYAKNHPNEQGFLPGQESPVFSKETVSYGINICFDANFPTSAKRLGDAGAQLICYPLNNMLAPATADRWRERSIENLQARARETGCWVASSDVVGRHGEKLSHGCTCIVNPAGVVVARVEEGVEGVVVHDIEWTFRRREAMPDECPDSAH